MLKRVFEGPVQKNLRVNVNFTIRGKITAVLVPFSARNKFAPIHPLFRAVLCISYPRLAAKGVLIRVSEARPQATGEVRRLEALSDLLG